MIIQMLLYLTSDALICDWLGILKLTRLYEFYIMGIEIVLYLHFVIMHNNLSVFVQCLSLEQFFVDLIASVSPWHNIEFFPSFICG